MVRTLIAWVSAVLALAAGSTPARAEVEAAIVGSFSEGLSIETSGMHRANAGGVFLFGTRFAVDAQVDVEAWTRWVEAKGMNARGGGVTLGARAALAPRGKLRGPFVTAGGTYLRLFGDAEKLLDDTLGRADIGPNAFAVRVGAGYGFPTTKKVTISVRFDVNVWFIDGGDFPPERDDPYPNPISFHVALEFMRWM